MNSGVNTALERVRRAAGYARGGALDLTTPEGRSRERYRWIALSSLTGLFARAVSIAVGLLLVPLLLGALGKETYGLWAAVTSLVAWAALFDLGIGNGLVNAVSEAHGRDDRTWASACVKTAFVALGAIAAALLIAFGAAFPFVPWDAVFGTGGRFDPALVGRTAAAALAVFAAGLPLSVVYQTYAGYQRAYVPNLFNAAGSLATLGAALLAIRAGAGLPALILAIGGAPLLASLANLIFLRRDMPWLQGGLARRSRDALRRLLRTSVPLFLFQVGGLLVNQSQALLLAHTSGLATVADYSIVLKIYTFAVTGIAIATASFVPTFREAHERGDRAWVRSAFRHMLAIRLGLAAVVGLLLLAVGDRLLVLWLGRTDVEFGLAYRAAVAGGIVAVTWVSAFVDLMTVLDRIWVLVALVLLNGASVVLGTIGLAPRLGPLGAWIAFVLLTGCVLTWLVPLLARPLFRGGEPACASAS